MTLVKKKNCIRINNNDEENNWVYINKQHKHGESTLQPFLCFNNHKYFVTNLLSTNLYF